LKKTKVNGKAITGGYRGNPGPELGVK